MLEISKPLYFSGIYYHTGVNSPKYESKFWDTLPLDEYPDGAQFLLNLAKKTSPTKYTYAARDGVWSNPWPQEIPQEFKMPAYDSGFSKTFSDVTDSRALEVKKLINSKNQKFVVMYSGGIDSTLILTALIKNLTLAELKNVAVAASASSIVENVDFWRKFIVDKFEIFDTAVLKYDSLVMLGYRPITGDEGDSIFGTVLGLRMYTNYEAYLSNCSSESRRYLLSIKDNITVGDIHFSKYKDVIIANLSPKGDKELGVSLYDKIVKNIDTSSVPVYSVHDFFWWIIFNLKYLECAIRGPVYFNDKLPVRDLVCNYMFNWFNSPEYQKWSMVNNNNGQKIGAGLSSYKSVARNYINEFNNNPWYFYFKCKLDSLGGVTSMQKITPTTTPWNRFGVDDDFNLLYINDEDVQEYIKHHLSSYKRDW